MPTINHLPTELKSRIAQLCHEQDESYHACVRYLSVHDAFFRTSCVVDLDSSRLYGRSLGALSCTSRGWSTICAPLCFKVLRASQANTFFRSDIAFPHDIDFELSQGLVNLLGPPSNFRNLKCLKVSVSCDDSSFEQLGAFLWALPFLEELKLSAHDPESHMLDLRHAIAALGAATRLPPLRRLRIESPAATQEMITFASFFSSTLQALSLLSTVDSGGHHHVPLDWVGPTFSDVHLPTLRILELDGEANFTKPITTNLPSVSLPSLSHLRLASSVLLPNVADVFPMLTSHPNFSTLTIIRPHYLPTSSLALIRIFCNDRKLHLHLNASDPDPLWCFTLDTTNLEEALEPSLPRAASKAPQCEADLRSTVQFLTRQLDEVRATRDMVKLARLTQVLRPVELERLAMEK
ncbi:hypothetical protein JCM11641_005491 [Rhodosporidiobolus odoratus]